MTSPSAITVRGGATLTIERVTFLLEEAVADGEGAVLSIFVDEARTGDELMQAVERICRTADVPHRQVFISSVGRLRAVGVDVIASIDAGEPSNHHHVVFDYPIDAAQVAAFVDAWDGPVTNPTGGMRRRL